MTPQSRGSAFADNAAAPLAYGRSDDYTKESCKAGEATGIYGMAFVQNREICQLFSDAWKCCFDVAVMLQHILIFCSQIIVL